MRPTWDSYLMSLAHAAATMGTCSRRKVGAIAVRDKRVLATGFNGSPAGTHHCDHEKYKGFAVPFGQKSGDPDLIEVGENPRRSSCSNAVHAEANVIAYAAGHGVALRGATIYTNAYPCHGCMKQMVSCGIIEVVYDADYNNDPLVARLCDEAKVVLRRYEIGCATCGHAHVDHKLHGGSCDIVACGCTAFR